VAHQIRRAITLDPKTRLPRLEDKDEPFEAFLASCQEAGLHTHILSSRGTCSNVDSDPMMLVGVAKGEGLLQKLPLWDHGSSNGGSIKSSGERQVGAMHLMCIGCGPDCSQLWQSWGN